MRISSDEQELSQPKTISVEEPEHSFIIRALWYLFIGWWLTGIWIFIAMLAEITIIGLPIAFWMLNRLPAVLTLKKTRRTTRIQVGADHVSVSYEKPKQRSFLTRALYFILIGWWFSAIWMTVAYVLTLTIIGIPLALMMFNRSPQVLTLYRFRTPTT